jgi:hypothetical protein
VDTDKADRDHEKIEHGPGERSKSEEAAVAQVSEVALVLKAGEQCGDDEAEQEGGNEDRKKKHSSVRCVWRKTEEISGRARRCHYLLFLLLLKKIKITFFFFNRKENDDFDFPKRQKNKKFFFSGKKIKNLNNVK